MVVFNTHPVAYAQVGSTLRHSLIPAILQPDPYSIGVLLAIAFFYLVTYHRAAYHAGHSCSISAAPGADLIAQHTAYNATDDGASADCVVALAYDFDVVNDAIKHPIIGIL